MNKAVISREVVAALPELKYVGVTATGYNNVDVAACRERGIAVANVVGDQPIQWRSSFLRSFSSISCASPNTTHW